MCHSQQAHTKLLLCHSSLGEFKFCSACMLIIRDAAKHANITCFIDVSLSSEQKASFTAAQYFKVICPKTYREPQSAFRGKCRENPGHSLFSVSDSWNDNQEANPENSRKPLGGSQIGQSGVIFLGLADGNCQSRASAPLFVASHCIDTSCHRRVLWSRLLRNRGASEILQAKRALRVLRHDQMNTNVFSALTRTYLYNLREVRLTSGTSDRAELLLPNSL